MATLSFLLKNHKLILAAVIRYLITQICWLAYSLSSYTCTLYTVHSYRTAFKCTTLRLFNHFFVCTFSAVTPCCCCFCFRYVEFEMNFAGSNIIVFIFSPRCENNNVCQMFRKCLAVLQCIKMNIYGSRIFFYIMSSWHYSAIFPHILHAMT